jgi:thiol-disulfide isomerase/thioredoxin
MPGKPLTSCAAAALALALTAAGTAGDDENVKTITIGDPAPPIDIAHWVKGVEMDKRGAFTPITEFEDGKVYVLEFWATWCGPCRASMPHLSELQAKYKDYDVTIIGISDETLPKVTDFLFKTDKDGKVNNDRTHYTLTTDPDMSVKKDYFTAAGRTGIPCSFIIGKDSKVEWIGHPMSMDDPLDAIVRDTWDRGEFKTTYEQEMKAKRAMQNARQKLHKARQAGDWDTVLEIIDDVLATSPDNTDLLMQKFNVLLAMGKSKKAYALGHKIVDKNWESSGLLNAIAWQVATDESIQDRNLEFAMKAAMQANELTGSKDAAILDTVARVHYEMGHLKKAIKWQKKAVEHAGDGQLGDQLRAALEQYEREAKKY